MKKTKLIKSVNWIARILAIIFAVFISIFALDVFVEEYTILETLVALFMHLIPTFCLIIALIIGWKNSLRGTIAFFILFAASLIFFHTFRNLLIFLFISFPPLVISALFFVAWKLKK